MPYYAKDIMSDKLITLHPELTCQEAAEVFTVNKISGAPVVDNNGVLIGVVTMQDLMRAEIDIPYEADYFSQSQLNRMMGEEGFYVIPAEGFVSDYMSRNVYTAYPSTPVETLANTMFEHKIHRIIILQPNEQKPIGLVTTFDLLKLFAGLGAEKERVSEKPRL